MPLLIMFVGLTVPLIVFSTPNPRLTSDTPLALNPTKLTPPAEPETGAFYNGLQEEPRDIWP